MSTTRDEIVERGREEWEKKIDDREWRGWLRIGAALEIGRKEVENRLGNRKITARFKGRAFNEQFGLWLTENGFADLGGAKFASTRSHLMDCMENSAEIEAWRKELAPCNRTAWNHPTTVLRHWRDHVKREEEKARIAAGGEPTPKKVSGMAKANETIRNLVEENDRLRKGARGGELFQWSEREQRLAKVLVRDGLDSGASPDKITRVLQAALAELEATDFVAKEIPAQQRVKPVATGIKPVLPDNVLAAVRADYAAGMDSAHIANKHALHAKHGMYLVDVEKVLEDSETCAA